MSISILEELAAQPTALDPNGFNPQCELPYGIRVDEVAKAMQGFLDFIRFVNERLIENDLARLESMLMPANFSSIVGEYMSSSIPRHSTAVVKNRYHNGHPDMLPAGMYAGDAQQHVPEGIELKASRYTRGWQGHNAEDTWLMVFVFDSNRPADPDKGVDPKPFRFVKVVGARVIQSDWQFAGRSGTSRRTITASINKTGYNKMQGNWLYQDFRAVAPHP